jgi:hypothetical protein
MDAQTATGIPDYGVRSTIFCRGNTKGTLRSQGSKKGKCRSGRQKNGRVQPQPLGPPPDVESRIVPWGWTEVLL